MPSRVRPNLEPNELLTSVANDFEAAWDALAATQEVPGRGNFMFARQAMMLLELACRLCNSDTPPHALSALSEALHAIEPKYFTVLPGSCALTPREFNLPFRPGSDPDSQFLWAMFDLIRHGQAHQYQQITAELTDGYWVMSLTGAEYGETLAKVRAKRPLEHLGVGEVDDTLFVLVRPEVMFLDFQAAIRGSGLLERNDLRLGYLTRSSGRHGVCDFDRGNLASAFQFGGHVRVGIHGVTDV